MSQPIFVVGYPSYFGGADTELWHTVRLWRRAGYEVHLIPTWSACNIQRERLNAIGAQTVQVASAECLKDVPDLPGGIVVSFCNGEFLKIAGILHELHCRMVWVNCMTWAFPAELGHYEKHGNSEGAKTNAVCDGEPAMLVPCQSGASVPVVVWRFLQCLK